MTQESDTPTADDDADDLGDVRLPAELLRLLAAAGRATDDQDAVRQVDETGPGEFADLRRWLASMPVIEQAKGILMARYSIDADTAFRVLRRWSSHHNIKIRTLCRRLTVAAAHSDGSPRGDALDDLLRTLEGLPSTAE